MVRLAIYSDTHGNEPAFDRFIEITRRLGIDQFISLGDISGYCANPDECIDKARRLKGRKSGSIYGLNWLLGHRRANVFVQGNHDKLICSDDEITEADANPEAKAIMMRQRGFVTPANREWLSGLPREYIDDALSIYCNHSQPGDITTSDSRESWHYFYTYGGAEGAKQVFRKYEQKLAFIGHIHAPFYVLLRDGEIIPGTFGEETKLDFDRAIINVGSVGQPRDEDPRGSFVVNDTDAGTIELHRFEYDIAEAQKRMRAILLPERYARTLELGQVPYD